MVDTTRATSFIPGPGGQRVYFGEGEDEHFFLWPSIAPQQDMPLVVYLKPGHTFSMGERVMDPHTSSVGDLGTTVDAISDTYRWPIVSLEITPPYSASSPKREPFSKRPFPGALLSLAKFIRFLRRNARNTALWGANGSINKRNIMVITSSSGHTLSLLCACIPPEALPYAAPNALGYGPGGEDHRPDAVVGWIGQIDWTQFAFDPAQTDGPFRFDVMQYFFGLNSGLTNTALEEQIKRSASPWFWVDRIEPDRTKFWQAWGSRPGAGKGRDLTPALWQPGRIQSVEPAAFYDPHHYFQADPWDRELRRRGVKARTIWGTSTDNPQGPNNTTVTDKPTDILRWIAKDLGWRRL